MEKTMNQVAREYNRRITAARTVVRAIEKMMNNLKVPAHADVSTGQVVDGARNGLYNSLLQAQGHVQHLRVMVPAGLEVVSGVGNGNDGMTFSVRVAGAGEY